VIAGVAGLAAARRSMAVGEYVSVSAQRDSQQADIDIEQKELADLPRAELNELAMIVKRGFEKGLAI
jgi:vacuolar iron transporter family protein